ncbi:DNA topoisomerase [Quillaja saponaria]|uniref:DNA topoisomerase n=1 Tax=Quillaja saponaria TaxID=32244 RepID=A0AAD7LXK6_QUISA|nr:DNA topoisomerase [Quillaja saponaria]
MIQLQKSWLSTTTVNFPTPSTSSAQALRYFMMKLQFRVLQTSSNANLLHSPLSTSDNVKCCKCSQLKLRRARVSCTTTTNREKFGQSYVLFNSSTDGSRSAFTVPVYLRDGLSISTADPNNAIGRRLTSYGNLGKRFFSKAKKMASKHDNMINEDLSVDKSPPKKQQAKKRESVTKAKVIQGYLGDMFEVLPSYGHVRDLAGRSGSVRPDDDFKMVWEVPSTAWTHLKSIKVALSGAENLILASDPDREGEAIAWHIMEMLQQQDALSEDITITRVVFHEITEQSIKSALRAPREIDVNLVHAYLTRRALDYLIGFNVSPLLWRKLPGCQSAGRVQSAALALICDREMEVDEFQPQEYWTVDAQMNRKEQGSSGEDFSISAHLTQFDSKKLTQFSISSHTEAKEIEKKINQADFQIISSKKNKMRKNSPTPYITSTLQQDAANKLHFTATYTMKLAQKLYEGVELSDGKAVGLITYTRTDGLHISDDAVTDIRSLVVERYGHGFAPENARKYFKKVKNAQEAHEAIRPTDIRRLPSMVVGLLDEDSLKLYTLIWSRTVACQMEPATIEQIQVDIGTADEYIMFRSTCSRVDFLGYQAVFKDVETKAIQDKENNGEDREKAFKILAALKPGDPLHLNEMELKQHHTQPPPRYSEASLVKKLEELGIGRPSTYASTMKVLQDRKYVIVKSRVLYPEFRGRMVSAFLCHYFSEVTDYSFTADMETELDNVSAGLTEWKGLLRDYWTRFSSYCERVSGVHIHEVEKMLEKIFGNYIFASLPEHNRACPSCMQGTLIFKVSRYGAGYFIGCDQHPKCKYIAKTLDEDDVPQNNNSIEGKKVLGLYPGSSEQVLLKSGPYGYYVQLGEDRKQYLPKRASVSHIKDVDSITLEDAVELLQYPVALGNHPKDGQPVVLKLAKVGFSIRHRRTIASVPKNLKPNEITLEKALELLSGKDVRRSGRPKNKPKDKEAVETI